MNKYSNFVSLVLVFILWTLPWLFVIKVFGFERMSHNQGIAWMPVMIGSAIWSVWVASIYHDNYLRE